jgi:hypothetical protein
MTQNLDGSVNHFEVYTMYSKEQRDELFRKFRTEGDEYERQAVKFSGNEIVLDSDGNPAYNVRELSKLPKLIRKSSQLGRIAYRSTWSVAHPTGRG